MVSSIAVADFVVRERTSASAYIPELDGLRAVSIGLVVLSHLGFAMAPGIFGVTIFFFISGYLITGHLLAEADRRGRVDLPMFYLRRALRLYPALIVMVATGGAAMVALGGRVTLTDAASALFYAVNLREYGQLLPEPLPGVPHPYGVLWSLAVEEHFYLAFPLLVLLLARRRAAFTAVLAGSILVVTAWRVHMAGLCAADGCTLLRIEHGTDTRIDSIVYGALLATVLTGPWRRKVVEICSSRSAACASMTLLLAALAIRDPWFRSTFRFTLQGVGLFFGLGAVLFAAWAAPARSLLSTRALTLLGRWSYSLYLWHWIVLIVFMAVAPAAWVLPLRSFGFPPLWWIATVFPSLVAVSAATACASYYLVERPMVRVRRAVGSNAIA